MPMFVLSALTLTLSIALTFGFFYSRQYPLDNSPRRLVGFGDVNTAMLHPQRKSECPLSDRHLPDAFYPKLVGPLEKCCHIAPSLRQRQSPVRLPQEARTDEWHHARSPTSNPHSILFSALFDVYLPAGSRRSVQFGTLSPALARAQTHESR